jgi:hypothetical protein
MTICFFAALAIAVVAEEAQRVVFAFEVTARHVVKKERGLAGGMGLFEEPQLDVRLVFAQPGQIGIKMILVESIQTEQVATGMGGGQPHGAQARTLIDGPGDDLPEGEFALPVVAQGGGDAQFPGQALQHGDGSGAGSLAQGEGSALGGGAGERLQVVLVLEGEFDGGDFLRRAFGEVGDGAVLDLAVLAEGLAQQDAGVNFVLGLNFAGVQIHGEHAFIRIDLQ